MATNSRKGFELHEILRGGILRKFHTSRRFSRRRVVRNWSAGRPVSAVTDGVSTNLLAYDAFGSVTNETQNGVAIERTYDGCGRLVAMNGATYDYSSFGKTLIAAGPLRNRNPFRFSSEYADDATGLTYYNWRHYDPVNGRWLSEDPIGEEGGLNLYAFVENNPRRRVDVLGRDWYDISNFAAGFGDSVSLGLTQAFRQWLAYDNVVDYSSLSYSVGTYSEIAIETTFTVGGSMLRKRAARYAGTKGRQLLSPGTRVLRNRLGVKESLSGQVHHMNPIRGGRYPLPFKVASEKWNLEFVEGVQKGYNTVHVARHKYLNRLDKVDLVRVQTQAARTLFIAVANDVNEKANGAWVSNTDDKKPFCLTVPSIVVGISAEVVDADGNAVLIQTEVGD